MSVKARVKLPVSAKAGEIVVVKTLVSHEMQSGLRKDKDGKIIPRRIINRFECQFNGQAVFHCELSPAIAANPYLEFRLKIMEAGKLDCQWHDEDGSVYVASQSIALS